MRKIVTIVDGMVAKRFLESVAEIYSGVNEYMVVYSDDTVLPTQIPENFTLYEFDPTSALKLTGLLKDIVSEVFIVMKNRNEALVIHEIIRKVRKKMKITVLDNWGLGIEDKNTSIMDAADILTSRLTHELPNIPSTALHVGLGKGEIMEVSVPFSSSFVYRTVGNIEQTNWKISALYRNNRILLAEPHLTIQPNDSMLIVGEPTVLKNVYQVIKSEFGQFPLPFGKNLYLYLDMKRMDESEIEYALSEALVLQKKIKGNKLFIRIQNPAMPDLLETIKAQDGKDISVRIDYRRTPFSKLMTIDNIRFSVGLIIVHNAIFAIPSLRRVLNLNQLPVLKLGEYAISKCAESLVFVSDKVEIEKISPVVFDVSEQLKQRIHLLDYHQEGRYTEEIVKHYDYLSRIFSRRADVINAHEENPIRAAFRRHHPFLQILPFTQEVLAQRLWWFTTTDLEELHFKLASYPQLFVPVTTI